MKYEYLSKNLKKYRKKNGFTQKELGKKILKSEISIRKYESGNVNIPPSTLLDLCNVLKTTPFDLLEKDYTKYYSENFDFSKCEEDETIELSLFFAQEYKFLGNLFETQLYNIESKPEYLLGAILKFLKHTEKYHSPLNINYPEHGINKFPELNYFTDKQINDIVSKITELVKYEIYKIENNIK